MADFEIGNTPQALSALPTGARGVIHSLLGEHSFGSRIANLGFTVGALVSVRQNYGHGPMIVALRGTLVALGRAEAAKILVQMES
jgi:Fe2+ transport system protein FeoA